MAVDTASTTRRLATHGTEVLAVAGAVLRDEPVAVTAGNDGHVRFWSLADGTERLALQADPPGKAKPPNATALAADSAILFVGWEDGRLSDLDLATGIETAPAIPAHADGSWITAITSFSTVDGGRRVLSAATDGRLTVWDQFGRPGADPGSGDLLRGSGAPIWNLAVVRTDGHDVAYASVADGDIHRWAISQDSIEGLPPIEAPRWSERSAIRLAVREGRRATDPVLVATDEDRVHEIDPRSGKVRATFDGGVGEITALHVPDGGPTVVGGKEGGVALVGDEAATIAELGARVAAIGSYGGALIVGDAEGGVHLVEPAGGTAAVSDQVELQDDVPGETHRDDRLRRVPLAQALAVRLQRRHEEGRERSFLVHLDGPWGSGKTTVLNFVADSLGPGWTIVRYNAWRQSRIGPHWWTLLTALRGEILRRRSPAGRVTLWVKEMLHQRIGRASGLPATAFLVLVALAVFLWIRPDGTTASEVLTTFEGVAATGAALATLVAGSQFVGRFFGWHSPRGAKAFQDLDANPMDRVAQHFSWLVRQERRPIALFVDDLDRCPAGDVVELLESVQTLVRDAGDERGGHDVLSPCVVVAGDGAWIRNAFEESYREFAGQIAEPGRPLGYLFLAKIFQLTLPVPRISPVRQAAFFRELLGLSEAGADGATAPEAVREAEARVAAAPDDDAQQEVLAALPVLVREAVAPAAVRRQTERAFAYATEHRLSGFAELLPDNPRAVKRFLNAFALTRTVRTIEGQAIPTPTLALWTILQIRWPLLADALALHPEWAAPGGDRGDHGVPGEVQELLGDPGVQAVLRFADGGPLTPELVRACRGG